MAIDIDTTTGRPSVGERPMRRFSEGMERPEPYASTLRVGHFGHGLARPVAMTPDRIGCFADGPVGRPDASAYVRVSSFGDCEPPTRRRRDPAARRGRRPAAAHA
jgi:hypothetical protein